MNFKVVSLGASVALILSFTSPAALAAVPAMSSDNDNAYQTGSTDSSLLPENSNAPISYVGQSSDNMSSGPSAAQRQLDRLNNTPSWSSMKLASLANRLKIDGFVNFDAFYTNDQSLLNVFPAETSSAYDTAYNERDDGNQSGLAVEGVLSVNADVNEWAKGHMSIYYATTAQPQGISGSGGVQSNGGLATTRYYQWPNNTSGIQIEEAYLTIGNIDKVPLVFRGGELYLPFGQYKRNAMMPTLTQQLTELRDIGAQVSYVQKDGPLSVSAYTFSGMNQANEENDDIANFGVTVSVSDFSKPVRYAVSGYYLYNMADVGALAQFLEQYENGNYTHHVGAWGADAMVGNGPFAVGVQYVSAIAAFDPNDFAYQVGYGTSTHDVIGASPSAATVYALYTFDLLEQKTKLVVSYQTSRHAIATTDLEGWYSSLSLPLSRIAADYMVNIWDNTMVGFEFNRDRAYEAVNGGTDNIGYGAMARISVML